MFRSLLISFCLVLIYGPVTSLANNQSIEKIRQQRFNIKINKYGTLGALKALNELKKQLSNESGALTGSAEGVFQRNFGAFIPSENAPIATKNFNGSIGLAEDFFNTVTGGLVDSLNKSFNGTYFDDRALSTDEKYDSYALIKEILYIYDGDLSTEKKKLTQIVMGGFFNIDPNSPTNPSDPDYAEVVSHLSHFDISKNDLEAVQGDLEKVIESNKEKILSKLKENREVLVKNTAKIIDKKTKSVQKVIGKMLARQKELASSGDIVSRDQLLDIQSKVRFLHSRVVRNDLMRDVYKANFKNLKKMGSNSYDCQNSKEYCDELSLFVKGDGYKDLMDEVYYKESMYAAKNATRFIQELSNLTDNPDLANLAKNAGMTIETIDAGNKVIDLLSSAIINGGTLALGDVTSAAGIVVGLIGVFSSSSSGLTADQIILQELAKIHRAIAEVRREMHERFNQIEGQLFQLSLDVNQQFNLTNTNLSALKHQQSRIEDLLSQEKNKHTGFANIVVRASLARDLSELRTISHKIKDSADPKEIDDHFKDLVAKFKTLFDRPALEIKAKPSPDPVTSVIGYHKSFPELLKKNSNARYTWVALLSQIAEQANEKSSGSLCGGVNWGALTTIDLAASSINEALTANYDQNKGSLAGESKFLHFLKTSELDSRFMGGLREVIRNYDVSVGRFHECINQFSYTSEDMSKTQSLLQYLLVEYKNRALKLTRHLNNTLKGDSGALVSNLNNALRSKSSGLLAAHAHKFSMLKDESLRATADFSKLIKTSSYKSLDTRYTPAKLIESIYPTVKNCYFANGRPGTRYSPLRLKHGVYAPLKKAPARTFLKSFTRHTTWQSIYLGLNYMDACYTTNMRVNRDSDYFGKHPNQIEPFVFGIHFSFHPVEKPPHKIVESRTCVLKGGSDMRYHFFNGSSLYTHHQRYAMPHSIVKALTSSIHNLSPAGKRPDYQYIFNREAIVFDWLEKGKLDKYNAHCKQFGHVTNCYPLEPKKLTNTSQGLSWVTDYCGPKKIREHNTDALEKFNQLDVKARDLEGVIKEVQSVIKKCKIQVALNGSHCDFGTMKSLLESESEVVKKTSHEIDILGRWIRILKHSLIRTQKLAASGEVLAYQADLDLMVQSSSDLIHLILMEDVDKQGELRKSMEEGYNYLIDSAPSYLDWDLSPILDTEGYKKLKRIIKKAQ